MSAAGGSGTLATGGSTAQPLDCVRGVAHYINKILKPRDKAKEISGMKCLLVDKETKQIISLVYSMNDILAKEVFLVEDLNAEHKAMGHLKAICLIRPVPKNIQALVEHMAAPKFLEYHIFFTNVCPGDSLRRLADADKLGVVKQVQEFYADYYAVNPDLFSLNLEGALSLSRPRATYTTAEELAMKRAHQGLLSVLLSFKVKPHIRYQASSEAASKLALELTGTISGERELFTFNKTGAQTLLLVLDRREDPLTPLLTQWTYQAMIHELVGNGIVNNTVSLKGVPGVAEDMQEIVVSATHDEFFRNNMYANYGDTAEAVKSALDEYSASQAVHSTISSIEDMQRFFDKYPQLKAKGYAVSKHVALMSEIRKNIDARQLMELSEVEQNISASDDAAAHARQIMDVLSAGPVDPLDALRLLMIFTIRYEKSKPERVAEIRRFIADRARLEAEHLELVDTLLAFGGANVRTGDLFGTGGSMLSKLGSTFRSSVAGVSNVFTQHQPYLVSLLQDLAKGKLKPALFPFTGPDPGPTTKFTNVILFVIGGATYEEAAKVAAINAGVLNLNAVSATASPAIVPPPFRVVLGGTSILSSKAFLAELKRIHDGRVAIDVDGGFGIR